MRTAIITSTYPRYRGDSVGSFVHSLSRSLVRLGNDVTVLAPYDPGVVVGWQSDVKVKRIRYVWPESWSVLGHARSLDSDVRLNWHAYPLVVMFTVAGVFRLWVEATRQEAEVIYAQWLVPAGFIGAIVSRLTGVPLVVSLHGSDVFVLERYAAFRPVLSFVFRTMCRAIACSADLACRAIRLGLSRDDVSVIPYGVDAERYAPDPESAQRLRARLSIADRQSIVMVMGRLVYKKGFSYFLRAVPLVLAECPDTFFVIAGGGDLRNELQALAASLDVREHVLFAGQVPWHQTPEYFAMADVFVVPSVLDEAGNLDGLPNVLLESMASECAIVATNVAGIPEVVRDDTNGLLVPQRDERALAGAICTLLSSPQSRRRLGRAARESAINRLGWSHIGERVTAILEGCVKEVQ